MPTSDFARAQLASTVAVLESATNAAALAEADRLSHYALERLPGSAEAWRARGEVLFALGQTNEGLRLMEGAVTRQPRCRSR